MKSEPRKKKRQWIIGEDKILDIMEIDLLRHSCRKLKKQGVKDRINKVALHDFFVDNSVCQTLANVLIICM